MSYTFNTKTLRLSGEILLNITDRSDFDDIIHKAYLYLCDIKMLTLHTFKTDKDVLKIHVNAEYAAWCFV